MIIIYVILLMAINTAGMYLGYLFTETKYRLADKYEWLNFKPFTCLPCFTFHLIWVMQVTVAILLNSLQYGIAGVVFAFAIWFCLHLENNNKIEK